jgi:Fe-S-cluster containining protein
MLPSDDADFVQIVDAALADAAARSGHWLVCRPGCNQCCTGVFRISPLDAERLRDGLRLLQGSDPERAAQIGARVAASAARLAEAYPGDRFSGVLYEDEDSLERFEDFGNDETCPVLNPLTGTCDLYAHRPLTCRTFGPPVRTEDGGFGICELCFVGAPVEAVAAAEMKLPSASVEQQLVGELGSTGDTIVTFALSRQQG